MNYLLLISYCEGGVNTNKHKRASKKKTPTDSPMQNGELFDTFWEAYPKKVSRDDAQKAFAKRKPGAELLQEMLEALEWQRRLPQWEKNGGQYIPYPATWLNKKRWKDERPEPKRGDPDWLPTEEQAEEIERQAGVRA